MTVPGREGSELGASVPLLREAVPCLPSSAPILSGFTKANRSSVLLRNI